MGDSRRGASPSVEQVREYVLTMLEGLSGLAASVDDLQTRDRLLRLGEELVAAWTPEIKAPLQRDQGLRLRAAPRLEAIAGGADPGSAALPAGRRNKAV